MQIESLCVFCGSSPGNDASFMHLAEQTGRMLASRGITVVYGGAKVGLMGAVHPRLLREWKVKHPVLVFELDLATLCKGRVPEGRELSRFPSVRRDISILLADEISADKVRDTIGQAGIDVLSGLQFFSLYRGEGIDPGRKSLAVGLTFQDPSRTLSDQEVDGFVDRIVSLLGVELDAKLRG